MLDNYYVRNSHIAGKIFQCLLQEAISYHQLVLPNTPNHLYSMMVCFSQKLS